MSESKILTPEQIAALEKEGFDRQDPSGPWVLAFAAGIVITLVLVVLAVDYLFQATLDQNISESVLTQDSPELQEIRTKEAQQLNHYRYADAEKKAVRLPIDRAMELFAVEAKSGKLFYPTKPSPVKAPEPDPAAAAGAAAPASAAPAAQAASTPPSTPGAAPHK